jgi:GNAT superfamily N-acetyltransferase
MGDKENRQGTGPHLSIDDNCTAEDYKEICRGLIGYNHRASKGMIDLPCDEDIRFVLKDEEGNVCGGISGHIALYCFFIEELWIDENYRDEGYGKSLLKKAEKTAREKGCIFAQTNTFSFQSPDFYINHGYKQVAVVVDFPDDIRHHYFKKTL